jgi:ferredoxin
MPSRRVVLHFPKQLVDQPVVNHLVREYDLSFNILRANITPQEEGLMVLALEGDMQSLDAGLKYIDDLGVRVQPLSRDIQMNEEKCTQCGACIAVCPTDALSLDLETRLVTFDPEECVACELCVPVCPPRAMEVHF